MQGTRHIIPLFVIEVAAFKIIFSYICKNLREKNTFLTIANRKNTFYITQFLVLQKLKNY